MFSRLMKILVLGLVLGAATLSASAQDSLTIHPEYLMRYRMSDAQGGYFLTQSQQEGASHGYQFEETVGAIYPVIPGYAPDPNAGLVSIHQWTVIERGRPYAYYSSVYSSHGSNYHYDGVRGYMLSPSYPGGEPLNTLYSQTQGFFYGINASTTTGFNFQSVLARSIHLPQTSDPGCVTYEEVVYCPRPYGPPNLELPVAYYQQ